MFATEYCMSLTYPVYVQYQVRHVVKGLYLLYLVPGTVYEIMQKHS